MKIDKWNLKKLKFNIQVWSDGDSPDISGVLLSPDSSSDSSAIGWIGAGTW